MLTNLQVMENMLDYIEHHLDEKLDLDVLAAQAGYSKYHLSRLFTQLTEMSLCRYVQRRRLTEAARRLAETEKPILDIALSVGYETQAAFSGSFKKCYGCSPRSYRKKGAFYPQQLRMHFENPYHWPGEGEVVVRVVDKEMICLVGYQGSTRWGFGVIGKCWRRLHQQKHRILARACPDFLVGLNDYSGWSLAGDKQPAFAYFAAAEVPDGIGVPKDMQVKTLPPSRYVVLGFRGKCEDSLQPWADYVYKAWLPHTAYQLNENARYDFARYGEDIDAWGQSAIEFWVPII